MNITVYLGASNGNDQNLILAARKLGKWIGENGHTLVYGGSKCGLMGELAESVLKAKGKVIGVEPQFFIDAGFDYPKIDESKCTECGKCLKVCSFEKKEQSRKETYAAQAKDADLEENASGGIFTVLAQEVLKRKGIVYGCAMLYENQNLVIKHIGIDKIEELCKLKGSKYVQSNLENVYVEIKRHLEHNETVSVSYTHLTLPTT